MAVGGGVIGALRVVLGADTAAFETGLKKGSSHLDKFAATAKKAGIAIAGAMSLAAVGLATAIKGTLQEADKLGKMAQSIGIPVEELSALKHAADLSGVSLESLGKGVGRLSRTMVDAAQGSKTAQATFDALGISIRNSDGSLKSMTQILPEVAEKFSQLEDGVAKTGLAQQLFGRAGADLIPLLNAGKVGLAGMIVEARELGLVIDTKTAKAAETFNDTLTKIRRTLDGAFLQLIPMILPHLQGLATALLDFAKNGANMQLVADGIKASLEGLAKAALVVITILKGVMDLGAAVRGLTSGDAFSLDAWQKGFAGIGDSVKKTFDELASAGERVKAIFLDIGTTDLGGFGGGQGNVGKANPVIQNLNEIEKSARAAAKASQEATRAWEQMWQEGNRVWEETRTPLEKFNSEVQRLNELFQQGVITGDTYSRAIAQIQDKFTGASQFANSFASSLESAFVSVVAEGKKVSEVAKQLLKDFARLAAQAAFRSLLGGFGNFFGGGGLKGFASGGSFQVGGAGGIDSQMVAFKASPNEQVTVTKPGQEMGGGPSVIINQTNQFSSGITGTDRAWIESSLAQNKEQTKQETIGIIRQRRETDSGFI